MASAPLLLLLLIASASMMESAAAVALRPHGGRLLGFPATERCPASCANHQPHTLYQYPDSGAASSCGEVAQRGVSAAERVEIVAAHNTIRQAVRAGRYVDRNLPPACGMAMLKWDQELAEVAQRWADQCVTGHDQCRDVSRFAVGQNFAYVWSTAPKNWTHEALGQWFFDELPYFRQASLVYSTGPDPVSGEDTHHLTQLLWASTTSVGCGFIAVTDPLYHERRTYICNYGPAGNVDTEQIYQGST